MTMKLWRVYTLRSKETQCCSPHVIKWIVLLFFFWIPGGIKLYERLCSDNSFIVIYWVTLFQIFILFSSRRLNLLASLLLLIYFNRRYYFKIKRILTRPKQFPFYEEPQMHLESCECFRFPESKSTKLNTLRHLQSMFLWLMVIALSWQPVVLQTYECVWFVRIIGHWFWNEL